MESQETLNPLILDFLGWISATPRRYPEVMDAWRTSCPKLPVWEDANDRGFVIQKRTDGPELSVDLTPLGRSFLAENGRPTPSTPQIEAHRRQTGPMHQFFL